MGDGQCLEGGGFIRDSRTSNILGAYQFTGEVVRQTMTMDFAGRMERDEQGMGRRGAYRYICDRLVENYKMSLM